jgi:erythromycin esterase-like protein
MCGFYGLDLYNLSGSMHAVIDFLEREDPELARLARRRYRCLEPWAAEPQLYGRNALMEGYARCEVGAVQMLKDLLQQQVASLPSATNGSMRRRTRGS